MFGIKSLAAFSKFLVLVILVTLAASARAGLLGGVAELL